MRPMRRTPQDEEAKHNEKIRAHIKEAVLQGIDLQVMDIGGGISGTGKHVVPLQHLMQQNPIKKSSQAQPE